MQDNCSYFKLHPRLEEASFFSFIQWPVLCLQKLAMVFSLRILSLEEIKGPRNYFNFRTYKLNGKTGGANIKNLERERFEWRKAPRWPLLFFVSQVLTITENREDFSRDM